jgi:Fe-S cluster assembly protein SufD
LIGRTLAAEAVIPFTEEDVIRQSERLEEPDWLLEKRLAAWRVFEATPMPTLKDEPWRRTDVRMVHWKEVSRLPDGDGGTIEDIPAGMRPASIGKERGGLLTHLNGKVIASELAEALSGQGVIFSDLHAAIRSHPELVQQNLLTAVTPERGKFAALNAALWTHGVFAYVPKGVEVALPLHSLEVVTGSEATLTHILVALEEGASLAYVHESASPTRDQQVLHTDAVELLVGDGAHLSFATLQNWGEHVVAFGHHRARVMRDGHLEWAYGALGTRLSKTFMTLDLEGQGAWGRMSGLYFADGRQHLDFDTDQNHRAQSTTSDLLFKGALKGKSHTVWRGMILVEPGAQKADGFQADRNLLLSRDARSDSIPGLEIEADDVRCTHAATAGRMDETELFYLMSRGLPRDMAARLIVSGFFAPVIERIPLESMRTRLEAAIEAKLGA